MKKVLYTLSAALMMLVGCTKFAEDEPIKFDSATAPAITVSVVDDNTVSVTVAGAANTGFYSFAFASGPAKTVSASSLLSQPAGFSISDAFAGVVNFSAKPDTTFTVPGLSANTAYTVYAVAASKMGVVSDVATQSVTTTDTTDPVMTALVEDAIASDNVVGITFNEPVTISTGAGSVVAHYFAENVFDEKGNLIEIKSLPIPVDNVTADGSTLSIKIPADPIPGALVLLTMDSKVVVNATDLPSAAVSSCSAAWDEGKLSVEGIGFQYEKTTFDFALPMIEDAEGETVRMPADTLIYFSDWKELVMPFVAQGLVTPEINEIGPAEGAKIEVQYTAATTRRLIYPATNFGALNDSTAAVILDEAPNYGEKVGFTVEEGAFQDIWGNGSNAFTTIFQTEDEEQVYGNYFFSYGYKAEQFYGTYSFSGMAEWAGPQADDKVIILPFTDPDEESVTLAVVNLFKNTTCLDDLAAYEPNEFTLFEGSFNPHNGQVTLFASDIGFGEHKSGWKGPVVVWDEDGKIVFQMPQVGVLNLVKPVDVDLYQATTWDTVFPGKLVKISDDYAFEFPEDDMDGARPKALKASRPANHVELRKWND